MPRKATGRIRNKEIKVSLDTKTYDLLHSLEKTSTSIVENLTHSLLNAEDHTHPSHRLIQDIPKTIRPSELHKREKRIKIRVSEVFYKNYLTQLPSMMGCKSISTAIYRMILDALYTDDPKQASFVGSTTTKKTSKAKTFNVSLDRSLHRLISDNLNNYDIQPSDMVMSMIAKDENYEKWMKETVEFVPANKGKKENLLVHFSPGDYATFSSALKDENLQREVVRATLTEEEFVYQLLYSSVCK